MSLAACGSPCAPGTRAVSTLHCVSVSPLSSRVRKNSPAVVAVLYMTAPRPRAISRALASGLSAARRWAVAVPSMDTIIAWTQLFRKHNGCMCDAHHAYTLKGGTLAVHG